MRTWASLAVFLVGCAHVSLPVPPASNCVGEYDLRRDLPQDHYGFLPPGLHARFCLALDPDGTYQRESQSCLRLQGEDQLDDGHWVAIAGGVRLGNGPAGRRVLLRDNGHVYLLGYRWLRDACATPQRPSLEEQFSRAARHNDSELPRFDEVCAAL